MVFIEGGKPTQLPSSSEEGRGEKWQRGYKATQLPKIKSLEKNYEVTAITVLLCSAQFLLKVFCTH